MPLQFAVLKLYERCHRPLGDEADLDLAGLCRVGVAHPIRLVVAGTDVPGEGDAVRRVPSEDFAPVALLAGGIAL